jgi:hypothetical protein
VADRTALGITNHFAAPLPQEAPVDHPAKDTRCLIRQQFRGPTDLSQLSSMPCQIWLAKDIEQGLNEHRYYGRNGVAFHEKAALKVRFA